MCPSLNCKISKNLDSNSTPSAGMNDSSIGIQQNVTNQIPSNSTQKSSHWNEDSKSSESVEFLETVNGDKLVKGEKVKMPRGK